MKKATIKKVSVLLVLALTFSLATGCVAGNANVPASSASETPKNSSAQSKATESSKKSTVDNKKTAAKKSSIKSEAVTNKAALPENEIVQSVLTNDDYDIKEATKTEVADAHTDKNEPIITAGLGEGEVVNPPKNSDNTPTPAPTTSPSATSTPKAEEKPASTPAPQQEVSTNVKLQTTADNGLNLRSEPSTSSQALAVLPHGTVVTATSITSDEAWYKVDAPEDLEGYVSASFVMLYVAPSTEEPGQSEENQPEEPTNTVSEKSVSLQLKTDADSGLNLRDKPDTSSDILDVLPKGTIVTATAITSNELWYKIHTEDGLEGYVSSGLVIIISEENQPEQPTPSVAPTPAPSAAPTPTATPAPQPSATPAPSAAPAPTSSPAEESKPLKLRTTADDGLRLRSEPNSDSSDNILTYLNKGTIVTAVENTATNGWYKVKTDSGVVGYISAAFAEVISENANGTQGQASISAGSATMVQYKTLYITGNISGATSDVRWTSDNSDVAMVYNVSGDYGRAFIYAKAAGTTSIRMRDSSGTVRATCVITVNSAEAVRFTYANVNTPSAGQKFNLIAVTDPSKTAVKFVVNGEEFVTTDYQTETASSMANVGLPDNTVRTFSKEVSFNNVGSYTIQVQSKVDGGNWVQSSSTNTFRVVGTQDGTTTSRDSRAASTEIINFIGQREGHTSELYIDAIGTGNPVTVGYGVVVPSNVTFYNNLTDAEMQAYLTYAVNTGNYATAVENYRSNYDIAMNQRQFDALVSFAYNLGGGALDLDWDTFKVLNNAVAFTGETNGVVNVSGLNLYESPNIKSTVIQSDISADTNVQVKNVSLSEIKLAGNDTQVVKERWYQVVTNNKTGWMRAGGVKISGAIDLSYIDEQMFGSNLLQWNKAGGEAWVGLVKRRLAEAKVFCYGGYTDSFDTAFNVGFDIPNGFSYSSSGLTGNWSTK